MEENLEECIIFLFYQYYYIDNLQVFCDQLFCDWSKLGVFG